MTLTFSLHRLRVSRCSAASLATHQGLPSGAIIYSKVKKIIVALLFTHRYLKNVPFKNQKKLSDRNNEMPRVKEPLSLDKKLKVQVGICRRMLKEVEAYQKEVGRAMHHSLAQIVTLTHSLTRNLARTHSIAH